MTVAVRDNAFEGLGVDAHHEIAVCRRLLEPSQQPFLSAGLPPIGFHDP